MWRSDSLAQTLGMVSIFRGCSQSVRWASINGVSSHSSVSERTKLLRNSLYSSISFHVDKVEDVILMAN